MVELLGVRPETSGKNAGRLHKSTNDSDQVTNDTEMFGARSNRRNVSKRTFSPGFSRPAADTPDMEYAMVDATIVKVHRHGQGEKGGLRARPSAVRDRPRNAAKFLILCT